MTIDVISWRMFLCAVSALNILAWSWSAVALQRQQAVLSTESYAVRRMQLLLSAGYVFGCAFRSVLPVYDIPRIVLVDSWLSSVIVGRTVATIAELCFAGQWAVMLRETARAAGSAVVDGVSRVVVPLIVIAETCSWYAVLTTWNLAHVAENSLWGICAALVVASVALIGLRGDSMPRSILVTWCVVGIAFVAFIFSVDVPMYWSRWLVDEATGRPYMSLAQGVLDAAQRRVVSYSWEDWKGEVGWMSLYFSAGVWISISLIHTPAPKAVAQNSTVMPANNRRPIGSKTPG